MNGVAQIEEEAGRLGAQQVAMLPLHVDEFVLMECELLPFIRDGILHFAVETDIEVGIALLDEAQQRSASLVAVTLLHNSANASLYSLETSAMP